MKSYLQFGTCPVVVTANVMVAASCSGDVFFSPRTEKLVRDYWKMEGKILKEILPKYLKFTFQQSKNYKHPARAVVYRIKSDPCVRMAQSLSLFTSMCHAV